MDFDVKDYEFKNFSGKAKNGDQVDKFEFSEFSESMIEPPKARQKRILREKTLADNKTFKISPVVLKYRGIEEEERRERAEKIEDEVRKRVSKLREKAYEEGHQEGIKMGRQEVYEQTRRNADEKITTLTELISDVLVTKEEIILNEKRQIYELIRTLTKWIILRELSEDGKYVQRLLEKLILEIQTKNSLLIQVDQKRFEMMPEVLEVVQQRLGELKNVRVELDYDVEGPGIIIESENGIINGSLNEQFKGLDKLFASVGLDPDQGDKLGE